MEVIQTERRLAKSSYTMERRANKCGNSLEGSGEPWKAFGFGGPSDCCVEGVSEKAGLQEEQAVHGLRSERARLAWGSGLQRGDGEERFRG